LPATPRAPARRLVIELTAAALARLVPSAGRMLGALTDGCVWLWGGLAATGCLAGVLSVLALVSLIWGLGGWHPRPV
jgi:predicted MFS family arabinose efflux permease